MLTSDQDRRLDALLASCDALHVYPLASGAIRVFLIQQAVPVDDRVVMPDGDVI
jgi:hypothetical protein